MIAEADASTPGNRFRVHDFPGASHVGPLDPTPVADALDTLAGRPAAGARSLPDRHRR